tara:strand:+ start:79 stop:2166 length:2088 start_codon:yes stop_codon:yes gene_type:complete
MSSKIKGGTGITRLLFGLKAKDLKVIPFNQMSPQQFEELDRFLGKVGFLLASDSYKVTKQQANYIVNQIKQLDLYRERIMPGTKPDFKDFIPRENLGIPAADKAREFKGFDPKVIQGGKDKVRPGKIDYNKMEEFLGVKLRGDETFDELLEIEKRMKNKDPEDFAGGGLVNLIAKMQAKFGKKAITTADKIARPESALNREMFGEFNERMNRRILDVEETPSGFKLSREKLLKNFPEIDEKMADEIMALDRDLQLRVITMLKDRRKNPEAYDKLLMEKGDTLDFQGEFDRSVQRSKNAGGGLATMFRPKREEFIFGGGVGYKGILKMLAKRQDMKPSDVLKQGNPKSQVPRRIKPLLSDREKLEMKEMRIEQLERQLDLLKTNRSMLANRENFPPQFKEVADDMLNMMLPREVRESLKGSTIESLDREILQIENVLKNLKIGKDKRALNADGGLATMFRPKLKDGGPPNPGRRNFMKLMAGLASLPIVGKLFKGAKVAKVVPLKNTTTTMPTWFPNFVDKMITKNVGNKIDADIVLYKDKDLPGVELYKYDDGRIEVQGKNAYDSEYDITYTPPGVEVLDYKTGKSVKTAGDFEASDTVYRQTGPELDDYDVDGEIVDDIEDILGGNSTQLEGYAKGTGEVKYTKGQYQIDRAEAMAERADDVTPYKDVDPTDFVDPEDVQDFAKGGLVTMFRKK